MLVTFSAHGAGAATVVNFRKNDHPHERRPEHRPRSLHSARVRTRFRRAMREGLYLTPLESRGLSTRNREHLNIRTTSTTPYNLKSRAPVGAEGASIVGPRGGNMLDWGPLYTKCPIRGVKKMDQETGRSIAINGHAHSLNQSRIPSSSKSPSKDSSDSSSACIDPRVLSKSYEPGKNSISFTVPPLPQQTIRESQKCHLCIQRAECCSSFP